MCLGRGEDGGAEGDDGGRGEDAGRLRAVEGVEGGAGGEGDGPEDVAAGGVRQGAAHGEHGR